MKEYIVELRVKVEDEVLEAYGDVTNLVLETTQDVPFSFDIEDCKEIMQNSEV